MKQRDLKRLEELADIDLGKMSSHELNEAIAIIKRGLAFGKKLIGAYEKELKRRDG